MPIIDGPFGSIALVTYKNHQAPARTEGKDVRSSAGNTLALGTVITQLVPALI